MDLQELQNINPKKMTKKDLEAALSFVIERISNIEEREEELSAKEEYIQSKEEHILSEIDGPNDVPDEWVYDEYSELDKVEGFRVQPYMEIALKINAKHKNIDSWRHKTFTKLQDDQGHVKITTPECGCSLVFKDVDDFPKAGKNLKCICKKPGHVMVEWNIID